MEDAFDNFTFNFAYNESVIEESSCSDERNSSTAPAWTDLGNNTSINYITTANNYSTDATTTVHAAEVVAAAATLGASVVNCPYGGDVLPQMSIQYESVDDDKQQRSCDSGNCISFVSHFFWL